MQKKIVIIISASIAAIKVPFLIKLLKHAGIDVQCILTENAKNIISKEVIEALSGNKVIDSLEYMQHISIARSANLIAVVPATANIMAKFAHGIADDLSSTMVLAHNKPILLAPAMNKEMWLNTATQYNANLLKMRGFIILNPSEGELACGEYGIGRIAKMEEITEAMLAMITDANKPLKGYKALVTAGPTREYIDDVRYISNNSSGMQGYAIANALASRGAEVVIVSAKNIIPLHHTIKHIEIVSAEEMLKQTIANLPVDIFVANAAVCDFKPEKFTCGKTKKSNLDLRIKMKLNPDILVAVSSHRLRPKLVIGFAMEAGNIIKNAQEKLLTKNCDWIFANSVQSANSNTTKLFFISSNLTSETEELSKKDAAIYIVNKITNKLT